MATTNLPPLPLPEGLTENQVDCSATGLSIHIIEAGYTPSKSKPLILLLHGYPELGFSWRKIMPTLTNAGYYVVAPDQRGYGRTTGWDNRPYGQNDMSQFSVTTLVRDMVTLVHALGYTSVSCVIGHDFGAVSAAMCALMRPDFFKSVITMSHPYKPQPPLPFDTAHAEGKAEVPPKSIDIQSELAKLDPPRKHYKYYNSTAPAGPEWDNPAQGMHDFLRGYVHLKSGQWSKNEPYTLKEWSAPELAKMPEYYILRLEHSMPEAVAANMTGEDASATKSWMPDDELAVYAQEWSRTGFQGGLNWYRATTVAENMQDLRLFAGKKIEVPMLFMSGKSDWGNYQQPGAIENLPKTCTDFRGVKSIEGAGHWPQQEKPEAVTKEILEFLRGLGPEVQKLQGNY